MFTDRTVTAARAELAVPGIDVTVSRARRTLGLVWTAADDGEVGDATLTHHGSHIVWARFYLDPDHVGRGLFTAALRFTVNERRRAPAVRWAIAKATSEADFYRDAGFVDDPSSDLMFLDERRAEAWLTNRQQ